MEFHPPRFPQNYLVRLRGGDERHAYARARWLTEADDLGLMPDCVNSHANATYLP